MFRFVRCMEDVGVLSMVLVFGSVGGKLDVGVLGMVLATGCSMAVVIISILHATSSDDNVT
jgi:hypothetical protein